MFAIEIENVWKEFSLEREKEMTLKERFVNIGKRGKKEKIVALKEISLKIKKGECFGILGKNGSGKTTLLKIMAGMLKPNKGKVKVEGKIVPILTLGLGLQRELTAKENIYLYASILGLKKKEIDERYERIVKFSDLEKLMDVKLKDFSDGMVMRLCFSTAFHVDADVILIDEVLSVGDAAFQAKCLEKIKELKEEGKTIVMVSHATADIRRFCDRALLLDEGKIIFSGEASKVCERYEEIVESERLRRWNEEVEKETGIEFDAFLEEVYILKTGEKCEMRIKISKEGLTELFFDGRDKIRAFSKKAENGIVLFQIDDLPLSQGEYKVWVRQDGKLLSRRAFKILVKRSRESRENRIYMPPGFNFPFQDLTIVFGETPEMEAEKFERGKTVFAFESLEEVACKNACLFEGKRILALGEKEVVLKEFKEKVWRDLAMKHFKDILLSTQLGKSMVIS